MFALLGDLSSAVSGQHAFYIDRILSCDRQIQIYLFLVTCLGNIRYVAMRMEFLNKPDKRIWAIVFGAVAAAIAGTLTRSQSLFAWAVTSAAILGSVIGWQLARRRCLKLVMAEIRAMGGVEDVLDQCGREMLTVWIPLDHDITDDDRKFGHWLGDSLEKHIPRGIAGFAALETELDKVGVLVVGRDADHMLEQIRPFFKQHCPQSTYVTRRRIPRADDSQPSRPEHRWPSPKPLFEEGRLGQSGE